MKKILLIIIAILLVAAVLLFLRGDEDSWICSNGQWVKHGNPFKPMPKTGCRQAKITPTGVQEVTMPKPDQVVSLPFTIKGNAKTFENQFNYRIKTTEGKIISQGNVIANPNGSFLININELSQKGSLVIEVFDKSAKDDSEIDKTSILVTVK